MQLVQYNGRKTMVVVVVLCGGDGGGSV